MTPALTGPKPEARQRPGLACERCRHRRLKCDGAQPQQAAGEPPRCSPCARNNADCEIDANRLPRGPKKGYIDTLRSRVAELESQLQNQSLLDTTTGEVPVKPFAEPEPDPTPPLSATPDKSPLDISESAQEELNQLYFDRVQPFVPLLQYRQYRTWASSETKTESQSCVQHAMWMTAALFSSQFQHLQMPLYEDTKRRFDAFSNQCGNSIHESDVEMAQTCVLVTVFESMKSCHRQAWMSAGRAFRMVQLMQLHELDKPDDPDSAQQDPAAVPTDHVRLEEKRRVFWMAYFLDHMFSMRNNWPITLNEHIICTRLPGPEAEFQSGGTGTLTGTMLLLGPFLSEAMTEARPSVLAPFNECIILATICGRSLLQRQQHSINQVYGDSVGSPEQEAWLEAVLENRLRILDECYAPPVDGCDPTLLFANIMAQATVVYLCQSMPGAGLSRTGTTGAVNPAVLERTLLAAEKATALAETLSKFYVFKVHPLTPHALFTVIEFLYYHKMYNEAVKDRFTTFRAMLGRIKNINDPTQTYLHLLGLTCVSPVAKTV